MSQLHVFDQNGILNIEFVNSEILDESNITSIRDELRALIEQSGKRPRLLLSFSNVKHLSSAALGMLIDANSRAKDRKGKLKLCAISPQILEVFKITKLDKVFDIYDSVADATSSF